MGGALRVLRNLRERFPADAEVLDAYLNAMGKAIEQQAARAQDLERQLAEARGELAAKDEAYRLQFEACAQLAAQRERDGRVQVSAYRLPSGVSIERVDQRSGPDKWAVRFHGDCLSTSGVWDYEHLPSSRDDEWLAAHRFETADAAIDAALKDRP
jgi:hypothetical protein